MGASLEGRGASLLAIAIAVAVQGSPTGAKAQNSSPTGWPPSQTMPPKPQAVSEPAIIITGSRIPRINLVAPSPVTVIDSQEVKYQGATAVEEFLAELPQVQQTQGLFASNGANGTASVDLR